MSNKHDEYIKEIADELIEQIKNNNAIWQKPWQGTEHLLPVNHQGKPYSGINVLKLLMQAQKQGYGDNRWFTYNNAKEQGGQVRRGEKGTTIKFYVTTERIDKIDEKGNLVLDENDKPIKEEVKLDRPKVVTYTLFNAQQIDGLPPKEIPPKMEEWERHAKAEAIINGIQQQGLTIVHQASDRAYYQPSNDRIVMPERGQFASSDLYYATLLHEIGHATGHESRLNRDLSGEFGSISYAKEELRAEISSLIIGQQLQIGHDPSQHHAYLQSWVKVLENDPKEIFRAVKDADKISNYLMDLGSTIEMNEIENGKNDKKIEQINEIKKLNIILKNFDNDPISKEVQDRVVKLANQNSQALIDTYKAMNSTFGGRYIASDMMKEVFEDFNKSPSHRNQFNSAVHNTAAALSAEHFRQMLDEPITDGRDTVVFLTGCPGASKTTTVMNNNALKDHVGIVFEGQLANAHQNTATTDKIKQALDNGYHVEIIAVNPLPEQALENTFKRYYDPNDGRGAPISTMARIQGNTYDGLKHLHEQFGNNIVLTIIDKPNGNENAIKYTGWEHLNVLKSQGTEQEIKQRLETHLLHHYQQGKIDYECFKQSAGSEQQAITLLGSKLARPIHTEQPTHGERREFSSRSGETSHEQRTRHTNNIKTEHSQIPQSISSIAQEKTYLYVPFEDKDRASNLGARWDNEVRSWYAPIGSDLNKFSEWRNPPHTQPPEIEFANFLRSMGANISSSEIQMDGRFHRLHIDGDKNIKKNAVYVGFMNNGIPAGYFENFKTGEKANWTSSQRNITSIRTPSEIEHAKQQQQAKQQEIYHKTAVSAQKIFDVAPIVQNHHYLTKKDVQAHNLRLVPDPSQIPSDSHIKIAHDWREAKTMRDNFKANGQEFTILTKGDLLIPAFNKDGQLTTFQTISNNGFKSYLKDGQKTGSFLTLGEPKNHEPILIAEGYATAATLHEQLNRPVIVAFDSGNLQNVGLTIREKFPDSRIYFMADNDHITEANRIAQGHTTNLNTGIEKATIASQAINGYVIYPKFDKNDTGSDFNDLYHSKGAEVLKNQIHSQVLEIRKGLDLSQDVIKSQQMQIQGNTHESINPINRNHDERTVSEHGARIDTSTTKGLSSTTSDSKANGKSSQTGQSVFGQSEFINYIDNHPNLKSIDKQNLKEWVNVLHIRYKDYPDFINKKLNDLNDKIPDIASGKFQLPSPEKKSNDIER